MTIVLRQTKRPSHLVAAPISGGRGGDMRLGDWPLNAKAKQRGRARGTRLARQ